MTEGKGLASIWGIVLVEEKRLRSRSPGFLVETGLRHSFPYR